MMFSMENFSWLLACFFLLFVLFLLRFSLSSPAALICCIGSILLHLFQLLFVRFAKLFGFVIFVLLNIFVHLHLLFKCGIDRFGSWLLLSLRLLSRLS